MDSRTYKRFVPGALCAMVLCCMVVAGCSVPGGKTGGRMDIYESDRKLDDKASMPALYQFCDETAEKLALELSQIPEVKSATTRLVLELGGLNNKTRTSTTDFEMIEKRLRGQLTQSNIVTDNFVVVISRRRMDRELDRIQGREEDLLQEGETTGTHKYDPKITYVLLGDFYEARRSGSLRYFFQFTLTNLASRSIVFQKSYDHAQKR